MKLFHGTDRSSAVELLNGAALDPEKASAQKLDGPLGFFLAFERIDAEFFALRRSAAVLLQHELSANATDELVRRGAQSLSEPAVPRSLVMSCSCPLKYSSVLISFATPERSRFLPHEATE